MQRDWEGGRLVGRYMVHRRIAAGGMATVHLGRLIGAAGFARTVAIKRLHDDYARDPDFVAMLLDEARLASKVRHPNVVPTLDVVAEQDELLVVMEYVEGESLAALHRHALSAGERFPIALAASIVAQALHGLHAAHEARDKNGAPLDIVHRDVSPQNVLVGADGLARVLDFGIAKAASRASATGVGQLKGKTAYMAPEQLQRGAIDRRTDVFAAAIVFWELLAGRRLFYAESSSETVERVLHDPIDSPQRWMPDVPTELALVTMRGLEREADARFATAEEMALAIEDAVALPRSKELGAWVSRVAASSIAARAALVGEVERESHQMPAASSTDPELRAALDEAERRRQMADLPTDVGERPSHGAGEAPALLAIGTAGDTERMLAPPEGTLSPANGSDPIAGPRLDPFGEELTDLATVQSNSVAIAEPRRRVSRAYVLGALAGGLALVASIVVALVVTRARGVPVDAAPPAIVTAEPDVVAELPPLPLATASADPAQPEPEPSAAAPRPPAKKRRPTRAKPDCRVPYVVDARGVRHRKPGCR